MTKKPKKGRYQAVVRDNVQIRPRYFRLELEFSGDAALAFAAVKPGQFAEFDLRNAPMCSPELIPEDLKDTSQRSVLLRRPFSFCGIKLDQDRTLVEVLYAVVGPATLRMCALKPGNTISVVGPLGNGFSIPDGKKSAILLSGGMGAPPIQHLAQVIAGQYKDIEVTVFAGARTVNDLPFAVEGHKLGPVECPELGIEILIATDDGSAGYSGMVTQCFAEWLKTVEHKPQDMIVYSCGPEPMLAESARLCAAENIECQVSMERRMACGTGLCQGCAVECKAENANTIYKMCCTDGPVFDSREVIFEI